MKVSNLGRCQSDRAIHRHILGPSLGFATEIELDLANWVASTLAMAAHH